MIDVDLEEKWSLSLQGKYDKDNLVQLRIHDTLPPKITANETFAHFWHSTLIPRQDRPHKVYIFLKLGAFCMLSQLEGRIQLHLKLPHYCE